MGKLNRFFKKHRTHIADFGFFGWIKFLAFNRKNLRKQRQLNRELHYKRVVLVEKEKTVGMKISGVLEQLFDFNIQNLPVATYTKNLFTTLLPSFNFTSYKNEAYDAFSNIDTENLSAKVNSGVFDAIVYSDFENTAKINTGSFDAISNPGYAIGGVNNPSFNIGTQISAFAKTFLNSPQYMGMIFLTTLYQTNSIAFRLANVMVQLFMSKWVSFYSDATDKDQNINIKKMEEFIEKRGIKNIMSRHILQMLIHGGVALYIETTDDDVAVTQPLKKELLWVNFKSYKIVDIALLVPVGFTGVFDFSSKNFNTPEQWQIIFPNGRKSGPIHRTRFIFGIPQELPYDAKINAQWWGNSIFVPVYGDLINIDLGFKSSGQQVQQASMAILSQNTRDEGLTANIQAGKNIDFQSAVQGSVASQNGSFTVIDAEDEVKRLEVSNLKDQVAVIIAQVNKVYATWGINLVRAWGNPLEGFSSGDAELKMSYESTQYSQEIFLRPIFNQLFETNQWILFHDKMIEARKDENGKFNEDSKATVLKWKFNPVYDESETQRVQDLVTLAQACSTFIDAGVPRNIIYKYLAREGVFPDMVFDDCDEYEKDYYDKVEDGLIAGGKTDNLETKDLKGERSKGKKPSASESQKPKAGKSKLK